MGKILRQGRFENQVFARKRMHHSQPHRVQGLAQAGAGITTAVGAIPIQGIVGTIAHQGAASFGCLQANLVLESSLEGDANFAHGAVGQVVGGKHLKMSDRVLRARRVGWHNALMNAFLVEKQPVDPPSGRRARAAIAKRQLRPLEPMRTHLFDKVLTCLASEGKTEQAACILVQAVHWKRFLLARFAAFEMLAQEV